MKKNIILFLLLVITLCTACNEAKVDEKKFYDLYTEILIVRQQNSDTAIANPLVNELFAKNNYTKEQFKADFEELAKDPNTFAHKIDSIRQVVDETSPKK
jgi:hypothetical protein